MSNVAPHRHEAAPSQTQLVFRRHPETGQAVEGRLRWGLIPHDSPSRPSIQPIHVRAETITEKPMFSDSYRKRRCVVPMNCYYQKDPSGRRHIISRRDDALFAAAGIWDNWRNPETGQWERTFAIVTVEANEVIARIHDRMLAILDTAGVPRWLSTEENPHDLLRPYPPELLGVSLRKPQSSIGPAAVRRARRVSYEDALNLCSAPGFSRTYKRQGEPNG
jgi:putative SOS response-associated peptidase YedK